MIFCRLRDGGDGSRPDAFSCGPDLFLKKLLEGSVDGPQALDKAALPTLEDSPKEVILLSSSPV